MTQDNSEVHVHPVGYRILVQPDEIKTTYGDTGIEIVMDKTLERAGQMRGTLLEAGSCAWSDQGDGTPWAKPGDWVLYAQHAGKTVEDPVTEKTYLMLNDKDVVAVIEKGSEEDGD